MSALTPDPDPKTPARMIPVLVILAVALLGAVLLREELSFDALAAHRAELLAFRDAHYALAEIGRASCRERVLR
jgi:hypothetical protein